MNNKQNHFPISFHFILLNEMAILPIAALHYYYFTTIEIEKFYKFAVKVTSPLQDNLRVTL